MPWTELEGEQEATVTIKDNGKIYWNEAARAQMGDPSWVSLWFDEEGNRLGLMATRNGSQFPRLRVYFDGDDYVIAAKQHLDTAGIDYSDERSIELVSPSLLDDPDAAIHWIQLE